MEKKYELTDEILEVGGRVLHRINALRNFGNIKQGEIGGWIENEDNLSHCGDCWVYGDAFPYRIRRLIPRECFRLMDVDDDDYDKIKNYVKGHRKNGKPMYISESQQYKLAGNSIVVACMEHIFEQLFFPSGRVTEPRQLDIFDII